MKIAMAMAAAAAGFMAAGEMAVVVWQAMHALMANEGTVCHAALWSCTFMVRQ